MTPATLNAVHGIRATLDLYFANNSRMTLTEALLRMGLQHEAAPDGRRRIYEAVNRKVTVMVGTAGEARAWLRDLHTCLVDHWPAPNVGTVPERTDAEIHIEVYNLDDPQARFAGTLAKAREYKLFEESDAESVRRTRIGNDVWIGYLRIRRVPRPPWQTRSMSGVPRVAPPSLLTIGTCPECRAPKRVALGKLEHHSRFINPDDQYDPSPCPGSDKPPAPSYVYRVSYRLSAEYEWDTEFDTGAIAKDSESVAAAGGIEALLAKWTVTEGLYQYRYELIGTIS